MTVMQTVEIPDTRLLTIKVPQEVPTGKANIVIFPVPEESKTSLCTTGAMPLRGNGEFRLEGDFTKPLKKRVRGCVKGDYWMADDFCEPLEDFKDYM